jgi:hypothetical protein
MAEPGQRSHDGLPTIDEQRLAGHERDVRPRQKRGHLGDLFRLTGPAQ